MHPRCPQNRARLPLRGLVIGVAGGAMVASLFSPAVAAPSAPSIRKLELTGHGFGHGHGMSQYGAEGAARKGKSYRSILNYYYPGTKLDSTKTDLRIKVSADTSVGVIVEPVAGLFVRDLGRNKKYTLPKLSGVTEWRIVPVKHNPKITKVQYKRKHWTRYKPGGHKTLKGDGEFGGPHLLTLVLPHGVTRRYHGRLRSASPSKASTTRDTVNVTTLDKYVRGVIGAEMPASWHAQALEAQAVAARTYAAYLKHAYSSRYYQVCDTTACQVYNGYGGEAPSTKRAAKATRGQILTWHGKPAFTQFSSSSGGWTSAGNVPYLPAKKDVYDNWPGNPVHTWHKTLSASTVEHTYPKIGNLTGARVVKRNGHGAWGGRALSVKLSGTKSSVTISGATMRSAFGLRSDWFKFDSAASRKNATVTHAHVTASRVTPYAHARLKVNVNNRHHGRARLRGATMTVKDGKHTVGKAKAGKSGKVTIKLKKLNRGTHHLTVKFAGTRSAKASAKKLTLNVTKAPTITHAHVTTKHVTSHKHAKVKVNVNNRYATSAKLRGGTVKITSGHRTVGKAKSGKQGKVTIKLKKLSRGKRHIEVRFEGTASAQKSSRTFSVRVR